MDHLLSRSSKSLVRLHGPPSDVEPERRHSYAEDTRQKNPEQACAVRQVHRGTQIHCIASQVDNVANYTALPEPCAL